ncbi:capsule synthesis protein PGA_cap [Nannocystis exedens]|uniref:Capsule synthesis protein PGA_cap n=1 Tax=Nannocystis exedens TaxID=54 RepID=A0A1I1TS37_9BACT|nr:CapA family protein [Nannocystis exedens]PCC66489.1 Capsule biosynthesis protein CapA [Nannocystis exedens]SFD59273.1 capsule synthesis protein PGA_cap [Nannocystis exedens]
MRAIAAIGLGAALACGSEAGRSDRRGDEPPAAVELWFAGDVHLGPGGAGALDPLAAAMPEASGVVNLEGPIDPRGAQGVVREAGTLRLFNGTGTPQELARARIAAVGLANNHASDAGPTGPADAAAALRAAGLAPFGLSAGVAVIERDGLRVALAGFDLAGEVPPGLPAALAEARRAGDVLAVGFHTTGPPLYLPEPPLRRAADLAFEAGAAVVVAHGSHSLAGAELRGGGVVAWGLGNAAFACDCTDEREGLVLRVRLGPAGVEAAALVPIDAGLGGRPARLAADPAPVLDLLRALGVSGRRDADRLTLTP